MAKLGVQNSEAPESINTKFGKSNYVGDIILDAKIQINCPSVGVPAHG